MKVGTLSAANVDPEKSLFPPTPNEAFAKKKCGYKNCSKCFKVALVLNILLFIGYLALIGAFIRYREMNGHPKHELKELKENLGMNGDKDCKLEAIFFDCVKVQCGDKLPTKHDSRGGKNDSHDRRRRSTESNSHGSTNRDNQSTDESDSNDSTNGDEQSTDELNGPVRRRRSAESNSHDSTNGDDQSTDESDSNDSTNGNDQSVRRRRSTESNSHDGTNGDDQSTDESNRQDSTVGDDQSTDESNSQDSTNEDDQSTEEVH